MIRIYEIFLTLVKNNDLDGVTTSLELGAGTQRYRDHALEWSAEHGNLDMVLKLLDHGANIHSSNDYALRWSARNNHSNVVEKLLERGADIDAGIERYTPSALAYSVKQDNSNMVIALLELGANVRAHNDYALRTSVRHQRYEIMAKLLESGADAYCNDREILKGLQANFNEQMADIILPYCDTDDYKYFPINYVRARIIPTKSANIKKIDLFDYLRIVKQYFIEIV